MAHFAAITRSLVRNPTLPFHHYLINLERQLRPRVSSTARSPYRQLEDQLATI